MSIVYASVTAQGAKGDGVTDDAAAIQRAINLGNITVPAGVYRVSGQIQIPSNRVITMLPGAVLKRLPSTVIGTQASFWTNSDYNNGNSNITIEGGTYDADQANQPGVNFGAAGNLVGGVGFRFFNVSNLTIKNVALLNILSFNLQIGTVSQFVIENVFISPSGSGLHQDGVHLNGPCSAGVIRNIRTTGCNDDLIALNADDVVVFAMCNGDISNVVVDGVYSANSAAPALRLLNGTHSITDVTVKNIRGNYGGGRVVGFTNDAGTPTGNIDRVLLEDFEVTAPLSNTAFMWWTGLKAGVVTMRGMRFYRGSTGSDPFGVGNYFLNMQGGSIGALTVVDTVIAGGGTSNVAMNMQGTINDLVINGMMYEPDGSPPTTTGLLDLGSGVVRCYQQSICGA